MNDEAAVHIDPLKPRNRGQEMNDEAAVHIDPLKPRNRGQEMMPWREIETIAKKGQISRSCVPVPGSAQVA